MTLAFGLLLVLVAAMAQVAVLPSFSIFGVHPNLVIALVVAWMTVRGRRESLLLIPAAGFLLGLFDSEPLGLAMLAFSPLILFTEVREVRLVESHLLPALVITAGVTLVYEGAVLLTLAVTGERADWLASALDVLAPAAIANALLLIPIYGAVRLASVNVRQRRPA